MKLPQIMFMSSFQFVLSLQNLDITQADTRDTEHASRWWQTEQPKMCLCRWSVISSREVLVATPSSSLAATTTTNNNNSRPLVSQ